MDLGLGNTLLAGDPRLVDHIVGEVKSQGIFDQFRKECIADVDTKPAYQNLRTRVESSVNSFLGKQTWKADLNKNQLRETLRKHIVEAPYLDAGVERIVDQVVNPKVYSVFMPQIEDVVYKFLGLERPKNRQKNGPCGFKDLLPKDLDPVSPESDKNSLKDVSLDSVDAHVENSEPREKETSISTTEQNRKDDNDNNSNDKDIGRNGDTEIEENPLDDRTRSSAAVNLNSSVKSDDKTEEEEEDSPTFEPIDIMNLNESNISNDSHLSGISELTSHRSRSPDFSNDASRDNMDFSNQDSQFSKVSSDSRLSIVTDFGSSNHASTPISDVLKDDKSESKYVKDNFKAVREFETAKGNKDGKSSYEIERSKENTPSDFKPIRRSLSSKETSRDGMESSTKDSQRNDSKSRRSDPKDAKKEREKDYRKKSNNHDAKDVEKSSKKSGKDKPEEKGREKEKEKKEPEKKDKIENKEPKDLKDIYKEKIRELREKKELTEKEKLSKDKDLKATKDTKEKRDSSRDKRDSKEHKSSSSKNSSRSESKNLKSSTPNESKDKSRDKGKRDDRKYSKDYKSKSSNPSSDDKVEGKRLSRSDEKSELKDSKQKSVFKKDGKNFDKRESKYEADKEKKRREDKKTKAKDDHSSLRKNSEDRRSTDRDGSNGSNGKSSQKSGSNSGASSTKPSASNLPKESTNTSNSSSETSDSIEESQNEKLTLSFEGKNFENCKNTREYESQANKLDLGQNEITLPIKKRPFCEGKNETGEILMKKPKFAKNFQEAKRLMKIRRKMEKEKIKKQQEREKNVEVATVPEIKETVEKNDLELVPDDERVQIIEVCDEEYDEPYPEIESNFTLEERSQIILGGESIFMGDLPITEFKPKSRLSEMELSIRQSLNEMISDQKIEETEHTPKSKEITAEESEFTKNESVECPEKIVCQEVQSTSNTEETLTKDLVESEAEKPEVAEPSVESTKKLEDKEKISDTGNEKSQQKLDSSKNQENKETIAKKEDEENKKNVTETRTVENKETVIETGNEKNLELVVEIEAKENDGKEAEIEAQENNEIEAEEINEKVDENEGNKNNDKVAEIEAKENHEKMIEAENDKNEENKKVFCIKNDKSEEIAEIQNEDNMTDIKNEENKEKVTGIKNEENKEKVIVTETCTKVDEIVRKVDDAQILKTPDNIEALKTQANVEEIANTISEANSETLEAPVNGVQPAGEVAASEVPAKIQMEVESCQSIAVNQAETSDKIKASCRESPAPVEEDLAYLSDELPCLYFEEDKERLEKFTKFLKALEEEDELMSSSAESAADNVDPMGADEAVASLSKPMAPPKPKRKYSTSPLTDILLNNANNNNDAHKITAAIADDEVEPNILKKRKIGRPKKQRSSASLCGQQNLLNGENFVMPLSPESDVSATSEKAPSNPLKDEKSRPRGSNQRYTSDDLYKPRPLFASSSRRSRRSNPA